MPWAPLHVGSSTTSRRNIVLAGAAGAVVVGLVGVVTVATVVTDGHKGAATPNGETFRGIATLYQGFVVGVSLGDL